MSVPWLTSFRVADVCYTLPPVCDAPKNRWTIRVISVHIVAVMITAASGGRCRLPVSVGLQLNAINVFTCSYNESLVDWSSTWASVFVPLIQPEGKQWGSALGRLLSSGHVTIISTVNPPYLTPGVHVLVSSPSHHYLLSFSHTPSLPPPAVSPYSSYSILLIHY